jgi:hypothetical protein
VGNPLALLEMAHDAIIGGIAIPELHDADYVAAEIRRKRRGKHAPAARHEVSNSLEDVDFQQKVFIDFHHLLDVKSLWLDTCSNGTDSFQYCRNSLSYHLHI